MSGSVSSRLLPRPLFGRAGGVSLTTTKSWSYIITEVVILGKTRSPSGPVETEQLDTNNYLVIHLDF